LDEARFQWWIQTKWQVLPTDPRFMDLTTEQMDLMYEHFLIDSKPTIGLPTKTYHDPDYAKEENIQHDEKYHDPDFDDAWNADDDEELNSNVVGLNLPDRVDDPDDEPVQDIDDWKEV
jgi:hypothetical protein